MAGGVYALLAVGTSIIFGVMQMINFASSAFFVAGMYFTWWGWSMTGLSIYVLIPFTVILLVGLAYVVYRFSLMPILSRPVTSAIIVTVGLSYFLQNLMMVVFGTFPLNITSTLQNAFIKVGAFVFPTVRLIAMLCAVVLTIFVGLMLTRTNFGRCLRATSINSEVAEILGVNSRRMYLSAWIIGIVLTGLAGLLLSPLFFITPSIGVVFRNTSLIACVLGGLGNMKGAFISGIVLGLIEALVSVFVAQELGPVGIFLLFLVVLKFKPYGLFGKGERVA